MDVKKKKAKPKQTKPQPTVIIFTQEYLEERNKREGKVAASRSLKELA